MDDLEDKTNEQLREEFHMLIKAHADLKEKMLKAYDLLEALEERGQKVYNLMDKRLNGQ